MGVAVSSSHIIFFIASTIVAVSLAGAFTASVYSIQGGIDDRSDTLKNYLSTAIDIINDPNTVPNNNLKIYVKNTGKCQLDRNNTEIIVDGCVLRWDGPDDPDNQYTTSLVDGSWYWNTTTVLQIEVTASYNNLAAGDHYVKVTVNGVYDTMKFRI